MNMALKLGTVVAVVLGFVLMVVVHQAETKHLRSEIASLRAQLAASEQLQDENKKLAEQLKAARETLVTERGELMRSRAQTQSTKQLEQENADLKARLQRAAGERGQPPPLPVTASDPARTNAPQEHATPAAVDLGAVELTHGTANRFDLGGGQFLTITPMLLDNGSLQMDLALTARGSTGRDDILANARVTAQEGQRASISVGERIISFEASLKLDEQ